MPGVAATLRGGSYDCMGAGPAPSPPSPPAGGCAPVLLSCGARVVRSAQVVVGSRAEQRPIQHAGAFTAWESVQVLGEGQGMRAPLARLGRGPAETRRRPD